MEAKLKEIDDFTYHKLTELMREVVPQYFVYDLGLAKVDLGANYLFMNGFATKLGEEMTKDNTSVFVQNSFSFINLLGESNNLEVLNILRVGILEVLYTGSPFIRKYSLERLNEKCKLLFLEWAKFYS